MTKTTKTTTLFSLGTLLTVGVLPAQDALESLDTVTVIGSTEDLLKLSGSGAVLEAEDYQKRGWTNIQQILRQVPGVYVREEDGYGNFPNISLRGGDGTRSEKVTLMEDGILTAPAPYSAPAAYYSPRAGRMSAIEVLKGSSQIQYGPQTTGGVINFLSTEIPVEETFYTRNTYGTYQTFLNHSYYGNTVQTKNGKVGYLFELFHHTSDGFRRIDAGGGLPASDNTGFTLTEPMVKLFWEPDTPLRQRIEFKLHGYSDFDSDESYIGLTENDVRHHPDRRYAATRFDNMASEQHRTYLKYRIEPSADFDLEVAGYYNEFSRNWAKVDDIVGGAGSVREALATGNGLDILQMRGPGELVFRNNNRNYTAYGLQLAGNYNFETGAVDHTLNFGARYHTDDVRRFQNDENIVLGANGNITGRNVGAPGSQGNRFQETDAVALWVQDQIGIGNLTITPGLRYENVDQEFEDFNSGASGSNTFDLFSPGIGFNYELANSGVAYGGVYRGLSIPGPRSAAGGVEEEESVGYELGYRYQSPKLSYDLTGFFTDFQNLIATDAGLGVLDKSQNVGEAEVFGLESKIAFDPFAGSGSPYSLPMYLSATWTDATLTSTITGGGSDDIYAGATDGAEIPYVPEWQAAAGIGLARGPWSVNLDMTFVGETYGTAQNIDDPSEDTAGAGSRAGRIDDLLLFDLTGTYAINETVTLLGGVSNLFDERAITSRLARGPRANIGRTAFIGFEARF